MGGSNFENTRKSNGRISIQQRCRGKFGRMFIIIVMARCRFAARGCCTVHTIAAIHRAHTRRTQFHKYVQIGGTLRVRIYDDNYGLCGKLIKIINQVETGANGETTTVAWLHDVPLSIIGKTLNGNQTLKTQSIYGKGMHGVMCFSHWLALTNKFFFVYYIFFLFLFNVSEHGECVFKWVVLWVYGFIDSEQYLCMLYVYIYSGRWWNGWVMSRRQCTFFYLLPISTTNNRIKK